MPLSEQAVQNLDGEILLRVSSLTTSRYLYLQINTTYNPVVVRLYSENSQIWEPIFKVDFSKSNRGNGQRIGSLSKWHWIRRYCNLNSTRMLLRTWDPSKFKDVELDLDAPRTTNNQE